jgi:uncharacterized glyoxalase superfamily metalloenzyme YdcJ
MYRTEVPQYGTGGTGGGGSTREVLAADPALRAAARGRRTGPSIWNATARSASAPRGAGDAAPAVRGDGHGAGRLYDLSVAGVPVHSTAFRPLTRPRWRPFRVFTSLLRLELIDDAAAAESAKIWRRASSPTARSR